MHKLKKILIATLIVNVLTMNNISAITQSHHSTISVNTNTEDFNDLEIENEGKCGESVSWTFYKNGTLRIYGKGAMKDWTSYFSDFSDLRIKKVVIESGVTTIGRHAFYQNIDLNEVTIPNTVTKINDGAFQDCSSLENITLSNNITEIGSSAFEDTKLKSITIPDSVKTIGAHAFEGTDITNIRIPKSVTSITDNPFPLGLESITVDTDNSNYSSKDGILYNKNKTKLIACPIDKKGTLTIPSTVTTIGKNAFEGTHLSSITLPTNLTTIEDEAFIYSDLSSITIPGKVSKMGISIFKQSSLKTVTINSGVKSLPDWMFAYCDSLKTVKIPSSVTKIGSCVFYFCTSLKSITIPNSVKTIDDSAFAFTSLTSIKIPDSVTSIGGGVFMGCDFVNASLSNNITSIQYRAFCECDKLKNIALPKTVKEIEEQAFEGSDSLSSLTIWNSQCKIDNDSGIPTKTVIYGYKNSTAEKYAKKHKNTFKEISLPKSINLSKTFYIYDGKTKRPTVTVKDTKGNTIASTNYTVSYPTGRKNVGTYKVTVKFNGEKYFGSLNQSFTIKPKATTLKSLTASSKGFTVKWNKRSVQTTGYQIQYSTSSKFISPKLVTVSKNSTLSKKNTKLSSKKKYFVRIRTYKTVNGKKYYSAWSKSKAVTTKK